MNPPASGKLNILVADDEQSSVISVAVVLRQGGHTVDSVADGAEALARLAEKPRHYHIVITDHFMLQVSGLELMAQLRATGFCGKIVVLSANLDNELMASYRALGADSFIRKPFALAELREAVEHLGTMMDY